MADYRNLTDRLVQFQRETPGWYWTDDGKLERLPTGPAAEVPWSYHNMSFQCVKWHEIFFKYVADESMVHSHCQQCFKVVISPRTIEELVALDNWQATLSRPCKCGAEIRDFVNRRRLYGGYFYNRGLEAGRECYQIVKAWAQFIHDKDRYENVFMVHHEAPMPVFLKLGCSEFERALGHSRDYKVTEEQKKIEAALDDILAFDPFLPEGKKEFPQPESLKQYVRLTWLRWAHHNGDPTYLQFMPNGQAFTSVPLYYQPPVDTYHEEG